MHSFALAWQLAHPSLAHGLGTAGIRLLLSPLLIGLASVVARRWGPELGGWLAALPLTSGPVILVLALERGAAFAADACVGIVLALVGLAAYGVVYAWASRRTGWLLSATLGCVSYLTALWPLGLLRVSLVAAVVLACVSLAGARRILPDEREPSSPVALPRWDIPVRMALAAALVWGIAAISGVAGPRLSGLLAPFPVVVTIMSVFTHRHEGPRAARRFLRGLMAGLASFAMFFLAVGTVLPSHGIALALTAGTVAALATHALLYFVVHRLAPRISHAPASSGGSAV